MAGRTNKDKQPDPVIDEVLNEDIPATEEASDPKEVTDIPPSEILKDPENEEVKEDLVDKEVVKEEVTPPPQPVVETQEQKDRRYRAQQTEAQIQVERNKALVDKVDQADKLVAPTTEELKAFVAQDGVTWDELTTFEQSTARRTYLAEKRFQLVNEAVQSAKKVDEWARQLDDFIDSTDGKPEYIDLSGNETDFRKFAMKESHRGTPIDILLGAFLHQLPPLPAKKSGQLFESGGGGEKQASKIGLTDADQVAQLRKNDPREFKRQLKAGQIKLEV